MEANLQLRPLGLSSASLKPILWDGGREGERRGVASQPTIVSFRANKNRWILETLDGASYRTGLAEKNHTQSHHKVLSKTKLDQTLSQASRRPKVMVRNDRAEVSLRLRPSFSAAEQVSYYNRVIRLICVLSLFACGGNWPRGSHDIQDFSQPSPGEENNPA
uniref:Uncharacterized protein n=1 Tax=Timema douglasi TaxID=61478 RepID=A0A7R8VMU6_TIMDO|nr:unnamed protein product [Timema douglasi]